MRKYTSIAYDRRVPQAKTICALPTPPEPPTPPAPTYLISGAVSRLGAGVTAPVVFVDGTTPLSDWTLVDSVNLSAIVNNASGAAYNPNTDSLWVPNNSTNALYEYNTSGTHLRTIVTGGFSDVEAVCWMYGSYFGILEEDTSMITVAQFLPSTGSIWKWANQVVDTGLGNLDVLTGGGLEGVCYNPQEDVFYAVKERQSALPTRNGMGFYRIEWSGSYSIPWSAPAMLPSYITDLSDIHYDPRTGRIYLLSDESEAIIEADPVTGSVYQVMNWPSGMLQPEGLTFTPNYTKMWIVSEPNQMRIYARDYTTINSNASTGSYGYVVSPGYSGTSIPSYTDGTMVPNSYWYLNVGANYANQDFEVTYGPIIISGAVTLDTILTPGIDVRFSGVGDFTTQIIDLAIIYQATVPYGYSGTVTVPEYLAYPLAFDVVPASRVYSNQTTSLAAEGYDITSKGYTVSGTYGDEFGSGGFDDYWVTNGTATWIATKATGSYGFDVLGGWSGSVAATQYIADPGSYAYVGVTTDQDYQNFNNPYPFITTANANLSWAWPLRDPERWLIIAKHPVTMVYSDYGTVAGTVYGLDVTPNFGTWFSVVGLDYKSDYNTNVSNEVQTSAPVISLQGSIYTSTGSGFPANVLVSGVGTFASDGSGQWGAGVTYGYSGSAAVADVVSGSWVPAYRTYTSIIATQTGQDFVFYPSSPGTYYLISGTVTDTGTGFSAGIEVDGVGTIFSAASGSYGVLVDSVYSGSFTPHYANGTFNPSSRYYTALVGDVPDQDFQFYASPAPTDCQIPVALQTVTDLPTPNDVSRSVNDPVNNLIWHIDDSYDYVYYVDAVAGTFQGSVTMPTGFGQSAIAYDAVNAKVVVMDWAGSIHYIDPVAKTSNRVLGISMVDPGYHMLTVNQYGTAYATDNRQVVSGSVWAIDGATETLIRSTKLGVSTDSICWASNINKLVINSGGAGQPAFYLFDPATDTFAASTLLNPAVSFRYENYYIPQTGHILESYNGGQPSAVIDISQGTAATIVATVQPTRISNADIDTCTNHLFITNGNYALWEYTLDGSYTMLNLFDNGGAGISPTSCSHNRQSNLIYVANYSDGTIYTFEATRQSGSIGGLVWTVDQGVNPDTTGGYAAMAGGLGWFSGSAVGEDNTPLQGYTPDFTASLSNLDDPYPATMQLVYSGSLNDSGTLQFASNAYLQLQLNASSSDVTIAGTTTGTNISFAGTVTVNGTIQKGYNTFEVYTNNYCGGNFTASPCNTYVAVAGSISFTPLTPP